MRDLPNLEEETHEEDANGEHDLDKKEIEHNSNGIVALVLLQAHKHDESQQHYQGSHPAGKVGIVVLAILESVKGDAIDLHTANVCKRALIVRCEIQLCSRVIYSNES